MANKKRHKKLETIYKVNKIIAITFMNGCLTDISWATERVPSILECWHLDSQSGNAISDVLFGDYNLSGNYPFPLLIM